MWPRIRETDKKELDLTPSKLERVIFRLSRAKKHLNEQGYRWMRSHPALWINQNYWIEPRNRGNEIPWKGWWERGGRPSPRSSLPLLSSGDIPSCTCTLLGWWRKGTVPEMMSRNMQDKKTSFIFLEDIWMGHKSVLMLLFLWINFMEEYRNIIQVQ
jgi:hypothetical protein